MRKPCETTHRLWAGFHQGRLPRTGRRYVQLTTGEAFCYPLYYFIPSITLDGRYLIHHRSWDGQVQLFSLDMQTGHSAQLTDSRYPAAQWFPWCVDPGCGVRDHLSALDTANDRVIYFDGNDVHSVDVCGGGDQRLFTVPTDRLPCGQNCVSPDGRWFAYIHHDRDLYEEVYGKPGQGGSTARHRSRGTVLAAFDLAERCEKVLLAINSPIHHVHPLGDDHLVFSSPAMEKGILMTDYNGGWYTHLRTQGTANGMTVHYCATARGIAYETTTTPNGTFAGVVDPETRRWREWPLPDGFRRVHTGFDPEGQLFFYELQNEQRHALVARQERPDAAEAVWLDVIEHWETYGTQQRSHFHPRLVLDGQWFLITAGDPRMRTNHCFLVAADGLD